VKTKSTKGKKISKSVPLKADKYYRRLGSNLEHSSEELDEANCSNTVTALSDNIFQTGESNSQTASLSKHHIRRVKANNSWTAVRQNLLQGRIEEEAFVMWSQSIFLCGLCQVFTRETLFVREFILCMQFCVPFY
jgi:hypothetical protein